LLLRTILAIAIGTLAGCAHSVRVSAPSPPAATSGPVDPGPVDFGPRGLPPQAGRLAPTPAAPSEIRTVARATVGAVGDVLMHESVKRSAERHGRGGRDGGYGWLFEPIADLLAEPDITFANLETPIAPEASGGTREYVFNAPPQVVDALRHAGVDAVSVANNHAFDQGRAGFEETLRRLDQAGMKVIGAGPEGRAAGPLRIDAAGLAIAFLGYAHFFNQEGNACPAPDAGARPCAQVAVLERARILEDVRAAAAEADAVVVSLHWGVEYEPQPRAQDVELAHEIVEAGALVVLGHHPHVLQPIELHRRSDGRVGVIAYSLGNFVSNQSRKYVHGAMPEKIAATRDGALLRVGLAKRDYGRGVVRVEVDGADFLPLWTENDTAEIDRKREPDRRPAIRVVAIGRALADVRATLARFPDPVPAAEQDRWVALRRREALLVSRQAAIASLLGEELLRSLAPSQLATSSPAGDVTPAAVR
jgi:poly-gamma-glutamate capsule biosynthesis protein CapA/YwtB (metallophosphatase superfamily)